MQVSVLLVLCRYQCCWCCAGTSAAGVVQVLAQGPQVVSCNGTGYCCALRYRGDYMQLGHFDEEDGRLVNHQRK